MFRSRYTVPLFIRITNRKTFYHVLKGIKGPAGSTGDVGHQGERVSYYYNLY